MKIQDFIDYCSGKKGAVKDFPFDDETLVMKVQGKMFALINLTPPHSANLKCDPVYAIALRQKFNGVKDGYHMDKRHWNTVDLEGDVPDQEFYEMIDDSYNLVVKGLTRSQRDELAKLFTD
jgi:predicted DNA-binding protein (MmcQ/YjbR family)